MLRYLSLLFVRAASWFVPQPGRAEFQREWRGELEHAFGGPVDGNRQAAGLLVRALGALVDAAAIRWIWLAARARVTALALYAHRRSAIRSGLAWGAVAASIAGASIFIIGAGGFWVASDVQAPDSLVRIWSFRNGVDGFFDREQLASLRIEDAGDRVDVAGYTRENLNVVDGSSPRHVEGSSVTANFFRITGATPILGRLPTRPDELVVRAPVSRGGYPELGSTLVVDGHPRTLVGVLPAGFDFPSPTIRIWLIVGSNNPSPMLGIARIRDAASVRPGLRLESLSSPDSRVRRGALAIGLAVLVALLLSASALHHGWFGRGASLRWTSRGLALLGLAALAAWIGLERFSGATLRFIGDQLELMEHRFTAPSEVTTPVVLSCVVIGLMLPFLARRHRSDGPRVGRAAVGLGRLVLEITLCLALVAAGLLSVRSYLELRRSGPGFDPDPLIAVRLSLPHETYPQDRQVRTFVDELRARVATLPPIESATVTNLAPFSRRGNAGDFFATVSARRSPTWMNWRSGDLSFFDVLGVTARTATDRQAGALVNRSAVSVLWGNRLPPNARIVRGADTIPVVGEVPDLQHFDPLDSRVPIVYLPFDRYPTRTFDLVVRSRSPLTELLPMLENEVMALDAGLALFDARPLRDLGDRLSRARLLAVALGSSGLLALMLLAVTIAGATSLLRSEDRVLRKLILVQGLAVPLGVAAALGLGRILHPLGVGSFDPTSLLTGVVLVSLCTLLSATAGFLLHPHN